MNRRVRACNVRVGDELDWFDAREREPVVMVVQATSRCVLKLETRHGLVDVETIVFDCHKKGAKRKQRYVWRTPAKTLMRVRREGK